MNVERKAFNPWSRFESCTPHLRKCGRGGNSLVAADSDMMRYASLVDVTSLKARHPIECVAVASPKRQVSGRTDFSSVAELDDGNHDGRPTESLEPHLP